MAAMNSGRVVMGGLVAGLVMNVIDTIVNATILQADMTALAQRFGRDPNELASFSAAAPWIVVDFLLGLSAVFTYAGFRPRFGPGPKTALLAALPLFIASGAVVSGFASMGMMSTAALVKGGVASLLSISIGALAGAWVYREA